MAIKINSLNILYFVIAVGITTGSWLTHSKQAW